MTEFRTEITADSAQFNATMDAAAEKMMTDGQRMSSAMREAFASIGLSANKAASDSEAASKRIDAGFSGVSKAIKSQFDGVAAVLGNTMKVMAGVGAAIAGGAVFKAVIDSTTQWTTEVAKLSKVLGTTTEQASVYAVALKLIGKTSDEYGDAAFKLLRQVKANEEALNNMGLATKDAATGGIRPMTELMGDAIKLMGTYKEGADRDAFALFAFGKGAQEMLGFMKLNEQVMARANDLATQYNLKVGKEGVDASRAYKMEQAAVGIMFDAIKEKIGTAVMPAFTQLAGWFSEVGPTAVNVITFALKHLVQFFEETVLIARLAYENVADFFERMGSSIGALGGAIRAFLSGDWHGMADAWRAAQDDIKRTHAERVANVERLEAEADARIRKLWDTPSQRTVEGGGEPKGTKPFKMPEKGGNESRMSRWEADLAAQRDAYDKQQLEQGSFQQFTLAMERDFWRKILDTIKMTDEERASASKKYYTAELHIRKQAFEAEIADIKERIARHKQGSLERIQLAGEAAAKIGQKYGLESKEYKQALGEMSKLAEERGKQRQKLEEMALEREKEAKVAVIGIERQALDDAEKLGLISAEKKLIRLRQLKEAEFQIELQALQDMAKIYELDELEYQQHLDKVAKLKEKHRADQAKIDGQIAAESKKNVDMWFDPIGNAFQKLMDGMIQGTQTWSQAIRKTLLALGAEYLSTGVKILAHWIKTEILKTQATTAGTAARAAAETAGSSQSILMSAWTAIKTIGIKAWEAAASVYAAIASIQGVGPFLAPAMAVAAAGTVLSYAGRIASAEGGFDVPRGLNPMTQIHSEEMVLPAQLANGLRTLIAQGGATGESAAPMNIYISALDGASVERVIRNNPKHFVRGVQYVARTFTKG